MHSGVHVVRHGGRKVVVSTDIGLQIQYDGVYNVFITVNGRYAGKIQGLCGTFTENTTDDFTKPDNQVITNSEEFGNSWNVDKACPAIAPPPDPCKNVGAVAQLAKRNCSVLKQLPFSACNKRIKVDSGFIQDCEYDVCACIKHPLTCLCEQYDAYVTTCSLAGVNIQWRQLEKFRKCRKCSLFLNNCKKQQKVMIKKFPQIVR